MLHRSGSFYGSKGAREAIFLKSLTLSPYEKMRDVLERDCTHFLVERLAAILVQDSGSKLL